MRLQAVVLEGERRRDVEGEAVCDDRWAVVRTWVVNFGFGGSTRGLMHGKIPVSLVCGRARGRSSIFAGREFLSHVVDRLLV